MTNNLNQNSSEPISSKLPYPLCIIEDRYSGAYSGAYFLAFNLDPYTVSELPVDAGNIDCQNFWEENDSDYDVSNYIIGKGNTPEEALKNLIILLQDNSDGK